MAVRGDLIIRDAVVFDGTAAARFTGDVGVAGDRIVAVGDLAGQLPTRRSMRRA